MDEPLSAEDAAHREQRRPRFYELLRLLMVSVLTGGLIGLVGTAFRFLLVRADRLRELVVGEAHGWSGLIAFVSAVALAAVVARWLVVRFAPTAAGSGIQQVEAVMRGHAEPADPTVIPVKFFGGLLAIGSGLALGREGPTVQMGAAIGTAWARRFLPHAPDRTIMNAAGAGAGLAVAFNAPIGASIFVFEELTQSFTPRLVLATIGAGAMAAVVLRIMLGNTLDFDAGRPGESALWHLPVFFALGAALGGVGAAYNALTLRLLAIAESMRSLPSLARAAVVGAVIGLTGWFWPSLVGGGDDLTQALLSNQLLLGEVTLLFALRFLMGPFSYAAGTPGGLFAPLLAVGAAFGVLFAGLANLVAPAAELSPIAFAVVGMSALFAAIVRAPLTGITLTVEMTGRTDLALAMLCASLGAIFVATWIGSEPIYDSLRQRMVGASPASIRAAAPPGEGRG